MGMCEPQRYNPSNKLDRLEEFWINKNLTISQFYYTSNENFNHVKWRVYGINKNCEKCLEYFIIEIVTNHK